MSRVIAAALGFIGLLLAAGGGWLVALGGSAYYFLAGVILELAAWRYWIQRPGGLALYLLLFVATCIWAVAEAGWYIWLLLPRLGMPALLAAALLAHWLAGRFCKHASMAFVTASLLAMFGALLYLTRLPNTVGGMARAPAGQLGIQDDWPDYGRDKGGSHYSPAAQITPENVGRLQRAWTLHTNDLTLPGKLSVFEATPIKIGDTLYFCTPKNAVLAIDATTGAVRWRFEPRLNEKNVALTACRGVSHAFVGAAGSACHSRILTATLDARLIALDALTGRPCTSFGRHGEISLLQGMGLVPEGQYYVTSPPAVANGVVILGGFVLDGLSTSEPSGIIRGFDVANGELLWAWDAGAQNETPAAGVAYTRGSPNSWSIASVDPALGLVYVPMGNATPDLVGMHRTPLDERYSSAVVALDVRTGQRRWSFQTVHHDLWDYDVGAQPALFDWPLPSGARVLALAQPTKHGEIYILDRRTGHPLVPVVERRVPGGDIPAEHYSLTQPSVAGFPSFTPPALREADMWGVSPLDQLWCRIRFRSLDYRGKFTPPSLRGSLEYPGNFGVVDWGGVTIDTRRKVMYVNASYMPLAVKLVPHGKADPNAAPVVPHGYLAPQFGTPYGATQSQFLSPLGIPCQAPPWGTLTALDLTSRRILWQRPLGTSRDHAPLGIAVPGIFNLGGSVVTDGGVLFIAATIDHYLRAFDVRDGRELWRGRLPAGGQANVMTYTSAQDGRQYVVVAAGGHVQLLSGWSDQVVAFALSDK